MNQNSNFLNPRDGNDNLNQINV